MKTKRSFLAAVLMLVLTLVLASCSAGPASSEPNVSEGPAAGASGPASASDSEPAVTAKGDILIAYFSYTGNTEEVAQQIAGLTGGTLAEIERAQAYGNLREEAEAEILNGDRPAITVSVDNVANYDTVFVGYPKMEQGYICV